MEGRLSTKFEKLLVFNGYFCYTIIVRVTPFFFFMASKIPLKRLKIHTEKEPLKKKSAPGSVRKKTASVVSQKSVGSYKAEDITVLEGLEPVRKRPGMYIGTTGTEGLHHLLWETFDNSRDEAMGGFADHIEIVLLPEYAVRVVDNGRGIPIDIHKQTKVSALETIMTTLHAGGKFGGEGYKISGGLHGVGISVVNALSSYVKAEVHRDGGKYVQEYKRGKQLAKVKKTASSKLHGTIITFEPDTDIFKDRALDWKKIVDHIRQQAYLVRGMRVTIIDARQYEGDIRTDDIFYFKELGLELPEFSFYFEGGIGSMVKFYNQALKPIHKNVFYIEKSVDTVFVEVALQYVDDISSREIAFANNTYNQEGGMHLTGFRTALTRTLNEYAKKNNLLKGEGDSLSGDDVREGLTAVISVKLREIQFEGQTKGKLGSVEARGAVEKAFSDGFSAFLEEKPEEARAIAGKVILALKARKAAKAAKDSVLRKGALEGFTLPGKLADCQTHDATEAELFIVEGDSAGGCFSGETEVALADGRNISFDKLVQEEKAGKQNFCYTIQKDGSIGIAPIINPRLTQKKTEVIKIILDNNEEIVCTPDHQFMLKSGNYKKARELTSQDPLMPLYRTYSKVGGRITIEGYEMVFDPALRYWIFTHLLSDMYNLEHNIYSKTDGQYRHHKDFNKLNNNPNNLTRLTKGDIDINEYNNIRKKNNDKSLIRYETICQRFFNGDELRLKEAVAHYNHRIKKIVSLHRPMDVYDLEVKGTNNFALASGVFVHNSAKTGRDRRIQAILPLRGKILNVERARLDKMLASTEIKALVVALGTAIGDTFTIEKLRYHKIIIATDADVDGAHIRTLLLTLFYRYFKLLIEAGKIYIATPPLYKIKTGKEVRYIYTEAEKKKALGSNADDALVNESEEEETEESATASQKSAPKKISVQRYKGLGEMNPEELWETTMNPLSRTLKQVTIDDAQEADRVFDTLMGTDVFSRKSFIQTHAKEADLDI